MTKLTFISMMIIFSCVVSANALSQDGINEFSPSEFFYGEPTVNDRVYVPAEGIQDRTDTKPVYMKLEASDFFYGPFDEQTVITENHSTPQRTDVAEPDRGRITPEVFYGYTDRAESKEAPCSNC